MAAISTRTDLIQKMAQGKGVIIPTEGSGAGSQTAATAASGFHTLTIVGATGTSLPSTIVGFGSFISSGVTSLMHTFNTVNMGTSARSGFWVHFYKMGTLNLAATGDQFTPDASVTYPLTRTVMGAASKPVTLLPIIQITTATTVTAPAFQLQTNAGAAGYVDQDGNSTVGNVTFTCPAAATAINGIYLLKLNSGDTGVRSISQIKVTTAGSAGAATIWGCEIIGEFSSSIFSGLTDSVYTGLSMTDMLPASPTSGTLTSHLLQLYQGAAGTTSNGGLIFGVLNV